MQEASEEDEDDPEDEVVTEVEVENEDEVVPSKKGKKVKLGRHEIAAIRTTVPTTGTKSAVEQSKRRERSSR